MYENKSLFLGSQNPASKVKCEEMNEFVENLSKIIDFLLVKTFLPGFLFFKAILCYFIYFTTDLESNAFELPIPMW